MEIDQTNLIDIDIRAENSSHRAILCLSRVDAATLALKAPEFLHDLELNYLAKLTFERRRNSYLLGRYCAKLAIRQLMQRKKFDGIAVDRGVMGHPLVVLDFIDRVDAERNPEVSISHTGSLGGAIAYGGAHPLALDVEQHDPGHEKAIRQYLTAHELELLKTLPYDEVQRFTIAWTAKEALGKILKCGLVAPATLWEIQDFTWNEGYLVSSYRNFPGFKCFTINDERFAMSIVSPHRSVIKTPLLKLQIP